MSLFFGRGTRDDPWLNLKIGIFTVGAVLAMLGVGLDNDWLVGVAAVVLAAGFLLRFLPGGGEGDGAGAEPRGPEEAGPDR